VLNKPLHALTFVALDLETTGLNAGKDRIVEIGASRFGLDGFQSASFSQLLNPELQMSEEVMNVHHICQEAVEHAPRFESCWPRLLSFISGSVLLAHNAAFDIAFLKAEVLRLHLDLPDAFVIDTFPLAKACFPEARSYALGRILAHLELPMEGTAHRALPDAVACQMLFQACVARAGDSRQTLSAFYDLFPRARLGTRAAPFDVSQLEIWSALEQALHQQSPIVITYTNTRKKREDREITPLFLGGYQAYAYVDAFCQKRQSQRRFYLNRIAGCKFKITNS
jgi:DNA polymerase III epsilon subunit family exonuclease